MSAFLYSSLLATVLLLVILASCTNSAELPTSKRCKPAGGACYEGTFSKVDRFRVFRDCCSPTEMYCNYDKPLNGYPGTCDVKTIAMWFFDKYGDKVMPPSQ